MGNNYVYAHLRVAKIRETPSKCEHCRTTKAKKFEWANLTGNYEDVNDYVRLCTSCHRKMDKTFNFLKPDGSVKIRLKKKCLTCLRWFQPTSGTQKRCGSFLKKIGCSYKHYLQYHKLRMRQQII